MSSIVEYLLNIEPGGLVGGLGFHVVWRPAALAMAVVGLLLVARVRLMKLPRKGSWWAGVLRGGGWILLAAGLLAQVDLTGEQATLRWQRQWPGWIAVVAAVAAGSFILAIYRRDGGPARVRVSLAWLRIGLVALLLALIWQPVLVIQHTRKDSSEVLLLVDDSASVATADRYVVPEEARHNARAAGLSGGAAVDALAAKSRWDLAKDVLLAGDSAILKALVKDNQLTLYTFASAALPRASAAGAQQLEPVVRFLGEHRPAGRATNVAGAVQDALLQATGRRVAAVVVVSDGRATFAEDVAAAVDAAKRSAASVHAVLLGSTAPPKDLWLGPVYCDENVFVKDVSSFRTTLHARGFAEPISPKVELVDAQSGAVLAAQTVELPAGVLESAVELRHKPSRPGRIRYRLAVAPDPQEVQIENNRAAAEVNVVDEKLHVLYVEGYPRFEYRYLKNTLIREPTVRVACLLLSADEEFPQEGSEPIRRFPESFEEIARYDVVFFGDVDPYHPLLSQPQLEMVVKLVKDRGAGFAMIAGLRHAPQAYVGTPIEKLLPVAIDPQESYRESQPLTTPFNPLLTPEGAGSPIFRIAATAEESLEAFQDLPGMYWFARTARLKPAAEALAVHPSAEVLSGSAPIVAVGRYGSGRTLFSAVDETWRWRYYTGEAYFDTYWLQMVRFLARNKVLGQGRAFALSADRKQYQLGEPVTVRLEVIDQARLSQLPKELAAVVTTAAGEAQSRFELVRGGLDAAVFTGSFVPSAEGSYTVSVAGLEVPGGGSPSQTIQVTAPDLEGRVLEADHAALRDLARQTGGKAVYLDEVDQLVRSIESRSQLLPDDRAWPLWDTKLALALLAVMILTEWIARKAYNLL